MALEARIENGVVYSPYPSEPLPEISLYRVVKQYLKQHGSRTAVIWENEEITFADLLKMLQRYAAGLQKYGIKKGDKVLVHLDNSLENMIAMYSIIFAGGVVVAAEPVLSNEDILYRIRDSNATYVLTSESGTTRFSDMRDKLDLKGYFTTGSAQGYVSLAQFKRLNENTYQEFPVEDLKNEGVVLLYTSGSTGCPKGVEHTHYSVGAMLRRPKGQNIFKDYDVLASRFSIVSSAGFLFFLRACSSGAKTVMFSVNDSREKMLAAIRKYEVTLILDIIDRILLLATKIEEEGIRLDCLKNIIITGSRVSHQTLEKLKSALDPVAVKDSYGNTEIGGICKPPMDVSKWKGIGFPAPMVAIKIVDPDSGNVLGPNKEGEVFVKSPTSMKGYYGNPKATSHTITSDGWLRTGDICYYNEDGQFFYVERMNQLFRCMGILVAPSSIENVLLSHDGIAEAAVIGVPHPEYVEVARAYVVLKPSSGIITEAALQEFVAGDYKDGSTQQYFTERGQYPTR